MKEIDAGFVSRLVQANEVYSKARTFKEILGRPGSRLVIGLNDLGVSYRGALDSRFVYYADPSFLEFVVEQIKVSAEAWLDRFLSDRAEGLVDLKKNVVDHLQEKETPK